MENHYSIFIKYLGVRTVEDVPDETFMEKLSFLVHKFGETSVMHIGMESPFTVDIKMQCSGMSPTIFFFRIKFLGEEYESMAYDGTNPMEKAACKVLIEFFKDVNLKIT